MILTEELQKYQHQVKLGKIDKYEYLSGGEIFTSDQSRTIGQAQFTCSLLNKAFMIKIKTIEDQEQKQIQTLEENAKQIVKSNANIRKYDCDAENGGLEIIGKNMFNQLINESFD